MAQNSHLFVTKETLEQQISSGLGMPVMTRKEAADNNLHFFWTGKPCSRGHNAKRRVKGGACVACTTIQSKDFKEKSRVRSKEVAEQRKIQKLEVLLKYRDQQKVLEHYSKYGDLEKAAKTVGMTLSELNVQLAKIESFGTAIYNLEKRMKVVQADAGYKPAEDLWDEEKRELFITAYVDTGDIASAREAVKVSASVYHKELERNPDFAKAIKAARPKAELALEEKAIQLALKGNDKLLTLVLKAKMPEYKDKIQIEQNTNIKLDDSQLNFKLNSLLNKYRDAIEGEVIHVGGGRIENGQGGEGGSTSTLRGIGSETDLQQAGVHVPSDGTAEPLQLSKAS